jgi:predicted O-methyltransferase YrrM
MAESGWTAVDSWIGDKLIGNSAAFQAIIEANAAAGLPAIDLSPPQAKLLHLLVRMAGARRVLEVGTLGGYSTAWLASALPGGGRVVTLEIDPAYAEVAQTNLRQAGVAERVELVVGPALESLERMAAAGAEPFDFVFIDADKRNNGNYLRLALRLSRPGTVIVCDNVVREGRLIEAGSGDEAVEGTLDLFEELGSNPRLDGTAIQTVGMKGWDGFAIALVGA